MSSDRIREGMILSGCLLLEKIGEGGMGAVFKAQDQNLGRLVAIKIMHPDGEEGRGARRFRQEAAAIARLDHPGLVRIYSYGEHAGQPYFVMEFVEGRSLKGFLVTSRLIHDGQQNLEELRTLGYLQDRPELPYFLRDPLLDPRRDPTYPARAGTLLGELAEALAEAHAQGIIHRDLKPSNILIDRSGRAKLVDFGLVKLEGVADQTISQGNAFLGTILYAAPEQFQSQGQSVSTATDLFSFGIVLYELVTLVHPFARPNDELRTIIARITGGELPDPRELRPGLSPTLAGIICRCLERDPSRRWASARDLAHALQEAVREGSSFGSGLGTLFRRFFAFLGSGRSSPPAPPVGSGPAKGKAGAMDAGVRQPRPDAVVRADTSNPIGKKTSPGPEAAPRSGASDGSPNGRFDRPGPGPNSPTVSPNPAGNAAGETGNRLPEPDPLAEPLEEIRVLLFHEFSLALAIEKAQRVLAIDPGHPRALFYLAMAYNAVGEHPAIAEFLDRAAATADSRPEADRRWLSLLRLLFLDQDHRKAEIEAFAYRKRFPHDPAVLWVQALAFHAQGAMDRVREIGREIVQAFPDDNLVSYIESDTFEDAGEYARAMEVVEERIRLFPDLVRLRLKVLGLAIFTGALEEAERHLAALSVGAPGDDLPLILRSRLRIYQGRPGEAADDLKTLIGTTENRSLRAFACFLLARIQTVLGQPAGPALEQARALQPEADYASPEEAARRVAAADLSGLAGALPGRPWLETALACSRTVCLDTLDIRTYTHGNYGRTTCFVVNPDGTWTQVILFCQFHCEVRENPTAHFRLPGRPQVPVLDGRGHILRMDIRPVPGTLVPTPPGARKDGSASKRSRKKGAGPQDPSGGVFREGELFLTSVFLAEPLRPGGTEFIYVELPPRPLLDPKNGRPRLVPPPFPTTSARRHVYLVYLPPEFSLLRCDPAPTREEKMRSGRVLVFERFLFGGGVFPLNLEMARVPVGGPGPAPDGQPASPG